MSRIRNRRYVLLGAIAAAVCAALGFLSFGSGPQSKLYQVLQEPYAQELIRPSQADTYRLEEKMFLRQEGDTDIQIKYPQVAGMEDEELQGVINEHIYDWAVGQYLRDWTTEGLMVVAEYETTFQSGRLLSVRFFGEPYVGGAAHPVYSQTAATIDMSSGELLCLGDVVKPEELRKLFEPKYFTLYKGIRANIANGAADYTELYSRYVESPIIFQDDEHLRDFYLRKGTLGMIVSVSHIEGDAMLFEGKI